MIISIMILIVIVTIIVTIILIIMIMIFRLQSAVGDGEAATLLTLTLLEATVKNCGFLFIIFKFIMIDDDDHHTPLLEPGKCWGKSHLPRAGYKL